MQPSKIRGPYELDIKEYDYNAVNGKGYNPYRDSSGRFTTGPSGSSNKITSTTREDNYQKQVKYEIHNDRFWVSSTATAQKQDGILGIKKGDVTINTSASSDLSVKDTKSFHSLIGSANKEGVSMHKQYSSKSLPKTNAKITKKVIEDGWRVQVNYEMKSDKAWTTSYVTKYKKGGFGIKDGEVNINTSASGDLTIGDAQVHHEMVGKAITSASALAK